MLYLIGIILTIFLLLLLVVKRNKTYSDKILMSWMIVMAIHQLLFYINYIGLAMEYPHLLALVLPMPVLHGPFLFLYVSSMTSGKTYKPWPLILHFMPFILLTVLAVPFYSLPASEKLKVFESHGKGYEWYSLIQLLLILVVGIGYVIWSWILIRRHRSAIKEWFSNTDKKNLQWLEYLSIGLGMIWLLVPFFDDDVIFAGVVVLVLFIGFFGINQLPIFYARQEMPPSEPKPKAGVEFPPESPPDTETGSSRYAKSGLKEEEANDLHERLTHLMEEKALYRQNELTLVDLAAQLDTHPNYLSQVINEKEHKNFYNYINTWRVKEFIQNATRDENKKYTLLSLAYDSGFNSKSTFNKYFKDYTGKSPSEYFSF